MTRTRRTGFAIFTLIASAAMAGACERALAQPATTTAATTPATTRATTGPATTQSASTKPVLPVLPATFPTTSAIVQRLPVPSDADQRDPERLVRNTFPEGADIAARRANAAAMLQRGRTLFDPPPIRYVLLRDARDAFADSGDAVGATAAVTELGRQFDVDAREMRAQTLERTASKATTDADFAALANEGMAIVGDTIAAPNAGPDDFATAARLGMATVTWASASHDGSLALRARAWNGDVQAIAAEAAKVQPALEKLKANPGDAAASLAVGKFRTQYQNDWKRGLPLLAAGSDETLAHLAKLELSDPKKQSEQLKLADAWWSMSQTASGLPRSRLLQRACLWYGRLYPNVVGPTRNHVERRLTEAGYTPEDLQELR